MMTRHFKGLAASEGIAIAKAYLYIEPQLIISNENVVDVANEVMQLENAFEQSRHQIQILKENSQLETDLSLVFEAHIVMLSDQEWINSIKERIISERISAAYALESVSAANIMMLESLANTYLQERVADIRDVVRRVTSNLLGAQLPNLSVIQEEVILVAHDLTPSDTVQLSKQFIQGFITEIGGKTTHAAILARALRIPAVVGAKASTATINHGDWIIMDGSTGEIIINPTLEELTFYQKKIEENATLQQVFEKLSHEKTRTADGKNIAVAANIGSLHDLEDVIQTGAEGIGLFRTEFLFMESVGLPTEEQQFLVYKEVLQAMGEQAVIVRTLDIGGDKQHKNIQLQVEANPFMGLRAVRFCLENEVIFRTQLRALLRASTFGNLKILFPMIATIDELKQCKRILQEEKNQLIVENQPVADIEIGIMVEIPATAILADQFVNEVDFFSIGTNDLIQYTMAADRMNERVSHLYQPYNPAVLRMIKNVIDASHQAGKWTGICGEMASETLAIPILLGLGMDELSMSTSSILKARHTIQHLHVTEASQLAHLALEKATAEEVVNLVQGKTMQRNSLSKPC